MASGQLRTCWVLDPLCASRSSTQALAVALGELSEGTCPLAMGVS